jgi:hypothetical protein
MYEAGEGVPQDYRQARRWFQKAADQGDEQAKCRLGWMDTVRKVSDVADRTNKVNERLKKILEKMESNSDGVGSGEHSSSRDHQRNTVSENEAYELLGVTAACTEEELKAAYRQKVNIWHPDKFHSVLIPEEMKEMATREMARINEAYDRLKSERQTTQPVAPRGDQFRLRPLNQRGPKARWLPGKENDGMTVYLLIAVTLIGSSSPVG